MKVSKIIIDKLPDNCFECIFSNAEYDNVTCLVTGETQQDYTGFKRMRTCKLKTEMSHNRHSFTTICVVCRGSDKCQDPKKWYKISCEKEQFDKYNEKQEEHK